jgi:sugar phosphate isomerase/epimerase
MEFGVIARCLSEYPWRDFRETVAHLGVEAIELDTRPDAHCNTWSPDLDPGAVAADLKTSGLRVGALTAFADLVQKDDRVLEREAEALWGVLDLAFRYRTEVVRVVPQRPEPGMSRQEMLDSLLRGAKRVLQHAEENAMLVCLHNDDELLRDAETFRWLIDEADSYNLKVALDVVELLRSLGDVEAVRDAVSALVPDVGHVVLRDAKLDSSSGVLTEVPVGQGDCPVEMVVSEMLGSSFYRPLYMGYQGEEDVVQSTKQGIDYFRELPERLLAEVGAL